jgi:nucleotide-binding universal stress UspA family protein
MYKHILMPYDGSGLSLKTLKEATAFAKSIGASLTLIHVVSPFHLHIQPWATPQKVISKIEEEHIAQARKNAQTMLSEPEGRARAEGVRCDSVVVVGDSPYREIIDTATKSGCDLIMMAPHGRGGIDAILLGSETTKVLTHSSIPVLVVR